MDTTIDTTMLESAVRRLGPERCEQALRAWDYAYEQWTWDSCPLTLSYGVRGQLIQDAWALWSHGADGMWPVLARLTGLSVMEAKEMVAAYELSTRRSVLKTLLEREAAKAVAA